jgi:hypothetical protein
MGLSDPRQGPLAVMCSRWRLPRVATPLPGRVSQVPRLICPCALPPLTPGSPATAVTHGFAADIRLRPNRADWPLPWRNEAETGLLALRLTGSPLRASPNGLLRSTPDRLHVEWAIYMVSSFHLTRSARLGLAHPINADKLAHCLSVLFRKITYVANSTDTPKTRWEKWYSGESRRFFHRLRVAGPGHAGFIGVHQRLGACPRNTDLEAKPVPVA